MLRWHVLADSLIECKKMPVENIWAVPCQREPMRMLL
jgi:hypothetical protein